MTLRAATDADLVAVSRLVNAAYRGPEAVNSWTHEVEIGGERTNVESLRQEIAKPDAQLLLLEDGETLRGCVMVERMQGDVWYLGMLTVRPDGQARGTGRFLLESAENFAREQGASAMHMTVVSVRTTLIAWYERRGYRDSGDRLPYPYGDPPRPDLQFAVLTKALQAA